MHKQRWQAAREGALRSCDRPAPPANWPNTLRQTDLIWSYTQLGPSCCQTFAAAGTYFMLVFRLDALALSVIAMATRLAGWLAGWVSVTAGIVSKRLNLSENFLDHLVGPSFKHLGPLTPIPNSTGNPFIGGVKYTGGGKIGDFC